LYLRIRIFLSAVLVVGLSACASARVSDRESTRLFHEGKLDEAAKRLEEGLAKEGENGRDLLLYLMDLATVYHMKGDYDKSIHLFSRADQVAEIKDYTSLATEAGTMMTSENVKSYKAEDFENVMLSCYLAIDYALLGKTEDAIVEAKRVNRKLYRMATEGKRKYNQNAFAQYLSGMMYESQGEYNSAYIDYKKTYELWPTFPRIGEDLWRTAYLSKIGDQADEWVKKFELTKEQKEENKKLGPSGNLSEIIVIYENGISPEKKPNPNFRTLPKFFPRLNPARNARVTLNGTIQGETAVLNDVEQVAIQNLDEKYGALVAKKIGGVVVKEVVGNQVANVTGEKGLGELAKIIMYVADQADLRSWNFLPKDLQVARMRVPPGKYQVMVDALGSSGEVVKSLPLKEVEVESKKKVFLSYRYVP